jgi:hypothetical protein
MPSLGEPTLKKNLSFFLGFFIYLFLSEQCAVVKFLFVFSQFAHFQLLFPLYFPFSLNSSFLPLKDYKSWVFKKLPSELFWQHFYPFFLAKNIYVFAILCGKQSWDKKLVFKIFFVGCALRERNISPV